MENIDFSDTECALINNVRQEALVNNLDILPNFFISQEEGLEKALQRGKANTISASDLVFYKLTIFVRKLCPTSCVSFQIDLRVLPQNSLISSEHVLIFRNANVFDNITIRSQDKLKCNPFFLGTIGL